MKSVIEPQRVVVRSKAACEGEVMIDDMMCSSGFGQAETGIVGEVGGDEADEQGDSQPPFLEPVRLSTLARNRQMLITTAETMTAMT